jgi:hypothetical protein
MIWVLSAHTLSPRCPRQIVPTIAHSLRLVICCISCSQTRTTSARCSRGTLRELLRRTVITSMAGVCATCSRCRTWTRARRSLTTRSQRLRRLCRARAALGRRPYPTRVGPPGKGGIQLGGRSGGCTRFTPTIHRQNSTNDDPRRQVHQSPAQVTAYNGRHPAPTGEVNLVPQDYWFGVFECCRTGGPEQFRSGRRIRARPALTPDGRKDQLRRRRATQGDR